MEYIINEPLYFKGENVVYETMKGRIHEGEIVEVQVVFPFNTGYVKYRISKPSGTMCRWISQEQILDRI